MIIAVFKKARHSSKQKYEVTYDDEDINDGDDPFTMDEEDLALVIIVPAINPAPKFKVDDKVIVTVKNEGIVIGVTTYDSASQPTYTVKFDTLANTISRIDEDQLTLLPADPQ